MAGHTPLPNGIEFSASGHQPDPRGDRAVAATLVVGLILVGVFGRFAYHPDLMAYEFTGEPGTRAAALDRAVWADFGFIAGYLLALGALGRYVYSRCFTGDFRRAAAALLGMLVVAALADVGEDIALLAHNGSWSAPFATLKWILILPTLLFVPAAVFVALRARRSAGWYRRHGAALPAVAHVFTSAPVDPTAQEYRWLRGYWAPTVADPTQADTRAICLSGGGIRAGSVALGALEAFSGNTDGEPGDEEGADILADTDYIISVSGGGFLAGAFLQAGHLPPKGTVWSADDVAGLRGTGDPAGTDPVSITTASGPVSGVEAMPVSESFKRGSVEYDQVRRRASYIADSPAELVVALGIVAKNMVLSLATVFAPAALLGVLLGVAYARIPLAAVAVSPPDPLSMTNDRFTTTNTTAAGIVIGVFALAAVVALCLASLAETRSTGKRALLGSIPALTRVAQSLGAVAGLVALAAFGIPWAMQLAGGPSSGAAVAGQVTGVVALNYVAVLAAILWRRRASFVSLITALRGRPSGPPAAVPRGALQLLIVVVTLAVLAAAWLLAVVGVAAWAYSRTLPGAPGWAAVAGFGFAVAAAIGVLATFDVTSTSLQPFYRRRLARAFALRRVRTDGRPRAMAYPPTEGTGLSLFDGPRRTQLGATATTVDRRSGYAASGDVKTPAFIFAAAAAVGGDDKPASGQNAISFVFSADYIGGPDLGWMPTTALSEVARTRIQRDLTVQAAVSISGAAFASAMGRMSRGYQTLLAVSGARLGSWLPNPLFLFQSQFEAGNPAWPHGMPSFRGVSYLGREILGLNSSRGRLVQVTDGGHYENLGLVEALRRRCTTIIAVDASGDTPPTLTTFADAMRLAESELGVQFSFDDPDHTPAGLSPGSPDDESGDFPAELRNRLAKSAIVRARFTYPVVAGGRSGTLILAKSILTPDLPRWLLAYAATNPVFPHDSTADQWFNEGQFAAYTELGRHIGHQAALAVD